MVMVGKAIPAIIIHALGIRIRHPHDTTDRHNKATVRPKIIPEISIVRHIRRHQHPHGLFKLDEVLDDLNGGRPPARGVSVYFAVFYG